MFRLKISTSGYLTPSVVDETYRTNDAARFAARFFELSVESVVFRISEFAAVQQSAGFSLFFAVVCSKNVVERSRIVRQV